jgi:hypothetical protein
MAAAGVAFLSSTILFAVVSRADASGGELLTNADFSGPTLSPWQTNANFDLGSGWVEIHHNELAYLAQTVSATPLTTYTAKATVSAAGDDAIVASVAMEFLDGSLQTIHTASSARITVGPDDKQTTLDELSPAGTSFITFRVTLEPVAAGGAAAHGRVHSTSLVAVSTPAPPDTATPTPTSTPTPVPSQSQPTPIPAAATPTPWYVPAPTATPRPVATSTPTRTGVSPSPGGPGGGSGPPLPQDTQSPGEAPTLPTPSPPFGGLLQNGDFEQLAGDEPAHWSKFGGTVSLTPLAFRGEWAASHLSTTASTKWMFQTVRIEGGGWYEAAGWARVESGNAELFIRVTWYASVDGSGSLMSQVDSAVTSSNQWTQLGTGAIQAPPAARSARVRLMLRPSGGASANWDDVWFDVSAPATPTPVPTATPASPGAPPPASNGSQPTQTPGATATPTPRSSGGPSPSGARPAEVRAGQQPAGGALLLSEIMSDPDVRGDNNLNEWVEVYNPSDAPVDLAGWTIADRSRGNVLPSLVVPPGEYAIIAARETELPTDALVVRAPGGRIGFGLRNAGDAVLLYAPDGTLVDAMSYGDIDIYGPDQPPAPPKGETLGRDVESADPGPWRLTLRPTPGEANVFPELEPEPEDEEQATPGATPDAATPTPTSGKSPSEAVLGESPSIQEGGSTSPLAWVVLGAAIAAGVFGLAPYVPRSVRRLREELQQRGR